MDNTFDKTNALLRGILNKEITVAQLEGINCSNICATLLPVKTVGVQGDCRSYQYVAGLSGERDWQKLFLLARIIPQVIYTKC